MPPAHYILSMPPGSILDFDRSLLVHMGIQAFNIIVLVIILSRFLYRPVRNYMDNRAVRISKEIEDAKRERDEAMELKAHYEKLIAGIDKERDEILLGTHKKMVEKSDQMIFDARREVDALYSRAIAELETEKKNMADEMKRQMVEISLMVAGRFVEVNMDRISHDRYIDEALAHWEES